jgi:hypothetical protein
MPTSKGIVLDMPLNVDTVSLPTAYDVSRYGNNGTVTDMTLAADGLSGVFNGSSAFVEIADDPSLDVGAGNFSVGFWMKGADTSSATVLARGKSTDNYWRFLSTGSNIIKWEVRGTFGTDDFNSVGTVFDTSWHRIDFTKDGVTGKFYIDGLLDDTAGALDASYAEAGNLLIGSLDGSGSFWHDGNIAQVGLKSYTRTPGQIYDRYQSTRNLFGV